MMTYLPNSGSCRLQHPSRKRLIKPATADCFTVLLKRLRESDLIVCHSTTKGGCATSSKRDMKSSWLNSSDKDSSPLFSSATRKGGNHISIRYLLPNRGCMTVSELISIPAIIDSLSQLNLANACTEGPKEKV